MVADALLKILTKDPTIKRHLLKTVSWRLVGSIDTVLLGWFITGEINTGAKIGGLELITKMLLYFFHERAWHRIKFGIPTKSNTAEKIKKENAANLFQQKSQVTRLQREELNENRSFTIWLTGLSASGKSSIAAELDSWFFSGGFRSYVIDGDNTRLGINSDLSFSKEDRSENIRRVGEICRLFNEAGSIVIASFISPFEEDRIKAKAIIGIDSFVEVFVDASLETCKARDVKGLYRLAEEGKMKNFTGINSPYEKPANPVVHLKTDTFSVNDCVIEVLRYLSEHQLISPKTSIYKHQELIVKA
jgi:adenylylsulfate kinase